MPSLITKRGKKRYLGTIWVEGHRGPTKLFADDTKKSYKAAVEWELVETEKFKRKLAKEEIATECLTVEYWVDEYLDFVMRHNFADKTYQEKKAAFERLAEFPAIRPDLPLEEIDRYLCAEFFNLQMALRTGNAVNKDRKNLGAAWQWGRENVRDWPLGENPFLSVAKKPETRQPRYVPPEADFWKVYDYVADKAAESGADADIQDRVMLLAYLHLAARKSELFRAKWADVDFSRGSIRLWTRKREGGTMEFDWLPLTEELMAELKMWAEKRLSHRTADKQHLFVCLSPLPCCEQYYGLPFTHRRHALTTWCEKAAACPHCGTSLADIDWGKVGDPIECPECHMPAAADQARVKPFGWHGIRHLTASTLYRRGYSLSHIQAVLRHKSATTTARYLRSLGIDEVRKVLDEGLQRECEVIPFGHKKTAPGGQS